MSTLQRGPVVSTEGTRNDLLAAREQMAAEGKELVDQARARGLKLRLVGGLAVRDHCEVLDFCSRDHSDLDMASLSATVVDLVAFFAARGYTEDPHARQATGGTQARFWRPCVHGGDRPVHEDDHVDVFLDTFVMDHSIDLRQRLDIEPYTLPLSDVLLTKLQIYESDTRDLRDAVTILKDRVLGEEDVPGVINGAYIARLCAADWGLYHDVLRNLSALADLIPSLGLAPHDAARVEASRARLEAAIEDEPKTRRWRRRARKGTRRAWHNEVEERDGTGG
jgi:hypothetical protein